MASRRKPRNTRAAPKKPKRKPSTGKAVVVKSKRKASPVKSVVRKPKPKPKPTPVTYPVEAAAKGPNTGVDTVKPVVIEPRRQVETSDALLFPSGRPIRKR